MTPDEAGLVFIDPVAYADEARFHEACAVLRREDPIHRVETEEFAPFHVITKHADVLEIELHNKEWENAPRPVISNRAGDRHREENGELLRTLIHMDDPDHRDYRGITAEWFLRKNMARLEGRLAELAMQSVDKMAEHGRRVRLRPRHRHALPAAGDPGHPRPARERLRADVAADPGAVRRRRRGARPGHADGGPRRRDQRLLRLLHAAHRATPRRADRRPGVGDRQRHDRTASRSG